MRTSEGRVVSDARPGASAGDSAPGRVPAQPVPPAGNVRVAPASGRARRGQAGAPASPAGSTDAALRWDCDVDAEADAARDEAQGEARDAGAQDAEDRGGKDNAGGGKDKVGGGKDNAGDGGAAPPRRPGRPRSERAEQAILDAAIEAFGEAGIEGVRCEDVAARAGVGKATLYRRWPGKEDLLIAAFAAMRHPLPQPRGASVRDDLIALLAAVAADADDPRFAQQYALLHGAGERYPRLVARYREEVIEPRRELVRSVLRRGVAAGELRPGTDIDVAMLLLTGAVMARGKHDPTPVAPGFVERAVDELLHGIAVPS